jgi:hypothetical protein
MDYFRDIFRAFRDAFAGGSTQTASGDAAWGFVEQVMRIHHFTREAQGWLRANVNLRVDDLHSKQGGGYWQPEGKEVRLFTAQDEAAVHELAHAWWHDRRHPVKDQMIDATVRLSEESDPRYSDAAKLAYATFTAFRSRTGPVCWLSATTGKCSPAWPAAPWAT